MVTNHGVHEWQVTPGLRDTGGQNVYVNHLTEALVRLGYRVTIVNRGGYPHPVTGRHHVGTAFHPSGQARILYLEDGDPTFVRKEDMHEHFADIADDFLRRLEIEPDGYDILISHYWDGGMLGLHVNERRDHRLPHVWVPHSLATLKRRNVDPATWPDLRLDDRTQRERLLVGNVDAVVATSAAIRSTLVDDYDHNADLFMPPCVDETRYWPRSPEDCGDLWSFLATRSGLPVDELRRRKLVTEISRTDLTKRKDVLLRAFARVRERVPDALLAVAINDQTRPLHGRLMQLIDELCLTDDVIVLGSVWEHLPALYSVSDVYCSPSVMEGFGMSAQEAAACGTPAVTSDLVPFATEYLLGPDPTPMPGNGRVRVGEGSVVVPADSAEDLADGLTHLLSDDALRRQMGAAACRITVPYFTWDRRTRDLLHQLELPLPAPLHYG